MEQDHRAAFLFPGNSIDYQGTLKRIDRERIFREKSRKAEELSHSHRQVLEENDDQPGNKELNNQVAIYTMCCSICDLYKKQGLSPEVVSGYSLGIYSALYGAEVYSFETGLSILIEVFNLIRRFYDQKE